MKVEYFIGIVPPEEYLECTLSFHFLSAVNPPCAFKVICGSTHYLSEHSNIKCLLEFMN